jgi:hypothetical protein
MAVYCLSSFSVPVLPDTEDILNGVPIVKDAAMTASGKRCITEADAIQKAFDKLQQDTLDASYQQGFFQAFPSSFDDLNCQFGYTSGEALGSDFKPGPLYTEYETLINRFFSLNSIDTQLWIKRIIRISIHGRWYVDGVSYFQDHVQAFVERNLDAFICTLRTYPETEIRSFWYFYFDGPHPLSQIPKRLAGIEKMDTRIFRIMKLSIRDVQKHWKRMGTD